MGVKFSLNPNKESQIPEEFKDLAKEINPDLDVEDEEALAKAFKFQGQDKLYNFLNSNPNIVDILEASVKSML